VPLDERLAIEVVGVDHRRVVGHGAGDADPAARGVHGDAVVGGVEEVLLAGGVLDQVGKPREPLELAGPQVHLDEPVEEADLEVDLPLAGRERHRSHGGAQAPAAGLVELGAQVVAAQHLEGPGVDDLEDPLTLGGIGRLAVERRVDQADARVVEAITILRVRVLVW
jgi:hypothetical protein